MSWSINTHEILKLLNNFASVCVQIKQTHYEIKSR